MSEDPGDKTADTTSSNDEPNVNSRCPVCGGKLISEKCKVVCRSERCRYRIVFNCAEF